MKVQVTKRTKEDLYVSEMPLAKRIIEEEKEDSHNVEEYALMVLSALGYNAPFEVYRPVAMVSKNRRIHDRYFEGSGILDVWVEFLAFDKYYGAFDCGVYLSDIWDLCDENRKELRSKMYFNAFERKH